MVTILLNGRVTLAEIHVTIRINHDIPHRATATDTKLDLLKADVRSAIVTGLQDLPEPPPEWGVVIEVEE